MTNQEAVSKTIPRQCTVVVLGAGRSGTSAITRGLQTLGVELGNQLRIAGGKNPTGFFEDEALLALNKRLKNLLGIRGDSVALIDSSHWQTPAVQALQQGLSRRSVSASVVIRSGVTNTPGPFVSCHSGARCTPHSLSMSAT